ncbi:response regulator [Inhella gelatinilytica]|uniref:Response regulator n=1 Tax=Inhella gelatinilytica TaxID=2795030 RepID=A0A931NCZ2_9BURK|nr:response regulator [Inhella gelatinilytica]MBH9552542.1 response regulator [Inhella gelatinilytica]
MVMRILIADDSKVSRTVIAGLIRNRLPDVEILEAGDGASALEHASTSTPDLAVLDINMPGITGLEVAERLRAAGSPIKMAILTANVQEATRAKADALGVPLFRKPAKSEVIDDILKLLTP